MHMKAQDTAAREEVEGQVFEALRIAGKVEDPELRKIAFDRVLECVLRSETQTRRSGHVPSRASGQIEEAADKPGPKAWLLELVKEGFFGERRSAAQIVEALRERGHFVSHEDLTRQLPKLAEEKLLRRKKEVS